MALTAFKEALKGINHDLIAVTQGIMAYVHTHQQDIAQQWPRYWENMYAHLLEKTNAYENQIDRLSHVLNGRELPLSDAEKATCREFLSDQRGFIQNFQYILGNLDLRNRDADGIRFEFRQLLESAHQNRPLLHTVQPIREAAPQRPAQQVTMEQQEQYFVAGKSLERLVSDILSGKEALESPQKVHRTLDQLSSWIDEKVNAISDFEKYKEEPREPALKSLMQDYRTDKIVALLKFKNNLMDIQTQSPHARQTLFDACMSYRENRRELRVNLVTQNLDTLGARAAKMTQKIERDLFS